MNIDISKLEKFNGESTYGIAKVNFTYDAINYTNQEIKFDEENLYIEFGYIRKNGELNILQFDIHDSTELFNKRFNHSALERLKRGIVALAETISAAKLCA